MKDYKERLKKVRKQINFVIEQSPKRIEKYEQMKKIQEETEKHNKEIDNKLYEKIMEVINNEQQ